MVKTSARGFERGKWRDRRPVGAMGSGSVPGRDRKDKYNVASTKHESPSVRTVVVNEVTKSEESDSGQGYCNISLRCIGMIYWGRRVFPVASTTAKSC